MHGHWRIVEGLLVGVAQNERHFVYSFFEHVVNGIAATAANTNNFNDAIPMLFIYEVHNSFVNILL